jgi:hypothetical protein
MIAGVGNSNRKGLCCYFKKWMAMYLPLANALYKNIIEPMLARYNDFHVYVIATGRAVPLMERTDIPSKYLIKQFYSDLSFKEKVVNYLRKQEQDALNAVPCEI